MTSFCGYFNRQDNFGNTDSLNKLKEIQSRARQSLSRNPRHKLHEYSDQRMFLIAFDNGAWQQDNALVNDHGSVSWISGNPIIACEDGISNDPITSSKQVASALGDGITPPLSRTSGSFSAVSWSISDAKLRLCSDKLALRPIYVYLDNDSCFFSSTIRVLREILPRELELDDAGIAQFIFIEQNIGKKTIFRNVEIVPPATVLEINSAGSKSISYYSWDDIPPRNPEFSACSNQLYKLFDIAIRRRARGCSTVDTFLTGGMDSRCVAAGLIDSGLKIRAFNYSYKDSADDILGKMIANKLGVDYFCYHSNPRDRLKINTDYFALNAREHFPRRADDENNRGRLIWSGDGGSVGVGHVYLNKRNVELSNEKLDFRTINELFPSLNHPISRLLKKSMDKELRSLAKSSILEYFDSIKPTQPSRKLFMYFLLNDQTRHLYHHYEQIDLSDIEFETPFFDMDFISFIVSTPIDLFLGHKLYNHWIREFSTKIDQTPWQAYPGHEQCPLKLPENILSQWSTDWYGGKTGSDIAKRIFHTLLMDRPSLTWKYLDRKFVYVYLIFNTIGITKYGYESNFARRVYEEIGGKLVFGLPGCD